MKTTGHTCKAGLEKHLVQKVIAFAGLARIIELDVEQSIEPSMEVENNRDDDISRLEVEIRNHVDSNLPSLIILPYRATSV